MDQLTLPQIDEARRAIVRWFDAIAAHRCPRCAKRIRRLRRQHSGYVFALPCNHRLYYEPHHHNTRPWRGLPARKEQIG